MNQPALLEEIRQFRHLHPAIEYVDLLALDLPGHFYGKRYPIAMLEKIARGGELKMAQNCILLGNRGGVYPIRHYVFGDGDPDAARQLVAGSLCAVPWDAQNVAQMLVTTQQGATPVVFEPRVVLDRIVQRFHSRGLRIVTAFELEFYLFDAVLNEGLLQPPRDALLGDADQYSRMDIDRLAGFGVLLHEICKSAQQQGIATTVISPELGPGQYEINFHHVDDPLRAADISALFTRIVRGVALKHSVRASFMPKPYLAHPGSGMHLHLSLYDRDGHNVLAQQDEQLLRYAIAGCLQLAPESMPIFASHQNAMRRYGTGEGNAARLASWGHDHREASIRIPGSDAQNCRIEHRLAGADANPYLVLAAILAGIELGLEQQREPLPSLKSDRNSGIAFATDVLQAVTQFQRSEELRARLGAEFVDVYAENRRYDHQAFLQPISAREYAWYA